jgi:dienelactone hydrolase
MKRLLPFVAALFVVRPAFAKLVTQTIEYKDGDKVLAGYLAYDDSFTGKRPGVLVVHEWMGLGDYAKGRAEQLAKLGYVAFAADMYGKGVFAKDHAEAGKLAGAQFNDRSMMRGRALSGLNVLKSQKNVDTDKLAAIGYCFGGTASLELARAGAPLKGVVSFHGNLATPHPEATKEVKAKILVCQGGDDQHTIKDLPAFEDEMRKANADWQVNTYSHAVHSFTVKEAGDNPKSGAAYNAEADARSWREMQAFFDEVFNTPSKS